MGGQWFQKHGPELAIGIGMVTIAGAGVGACFATAKTIRVIDRIEKDRETPLTRKEKFKVALPYFIGPAAGLILGSSFAIGGMNFGWKRTINIASAARATEEALQAHKDAAIDVVGEKKALEIDSEANKKQSDGAIKRFLESGLPILGKGDTYFTDVDLLGDRIFVGDIQTIRALYNDVGEAMIAGDHQIDCYNLALQVYQDVFDKTNERPPEYLSMLEYDVLSNGTPKIDIQTDPMDEQGRIIHRIVHLNEPKIARYY